MSQENVKLLSKIEAKLKYKFEDKNLLLRALTHRSFGTDEGKREPHNETLEFLGDAVLSVVAAEALFKACPDADEGDLSQARANYVCQLTLAQGARKLKLGDYVRVAKAMRASGPVDLPSVLADVMEAIFGATYLDGGLENARALIGLTLGDVPTKVRTAPKDAKTVLQERIQGACSMTPTYEVLESTGPAHAPAFLVEVQVAGTVLGQGEGSNKKQAAQQAAKQALGVLEDSTDAALVEKLEQK